jgi:hypothetical protein
MALLNSNIPSVKALVKKSYFTKRDTDLEWWPVYCFGIQSVSGRVLTFHVMTDTGMLRSRVPISEIYLKEPTSDLPFYYKQLWDSFSEKVSVTRFDFLLGHRAEVILRDGSKVWATYLFTVDWFSNPFSDEPSDYKCGHVLAADAGYLLCQPNNRLLWRDSNWVTKPLPDLREIRVDHELPSVENQCDRWLQAEDSDAYYYSFTELY